MPRFAVTLIHRLSGKETAEVVDVPSFDDIFTRIDMETYKIARCEAMPEAPAPLKAKAISLEHEDSGAGYATAANFAAVIAFFLPLALPASLVLAGLALEASRGRRGRGALSLAVVGAVIWLFVVLIAVSFSHAR